MIQLHLAGRLICTLLLMTALITSCKSRKGSELPDDRGSTVTAEKPAVEASEIYTARSMGLAYLEEGRLEEAEASFQRLIELVPDEALGYANLGIVYLRMARFEEAEKQLKKAIELDPANPDLRLNLAKVYQMSQREQESIEELEKTAEMAPEHLRTLFNLAESFAGSADRSSTLQWEAYMRRIVATAPGNMVARLHFTEALLRNAKGEEALQNLEEIRSMSPEFPPEAIEFYEQTTQSLRAGKPDDGLNSYLIFHNFLKLTNAYQAGVQQLKGSSATIGFPVITFRETAFGFEMDPAEVLEAIRFTDVTESAGLDIPATSGSSAQIALATSDFDRDGDTDIYFSSPSGHYLFRNDMGRFRDIRAASGIAVQGGTTHAAFADYDNDGFPDLYLVREDGNILYHNVDEGKFRDVSTESGTHDEAGGRVALFFDADQEGDLDIFIAHQKGHRLLRNNGDGTFASMGESFGFTGQHSPGADVVMGDFDDDGDVDLFVVSNGGAQVLFLNQRQGRFRAVYAESGIRGPEKAGAVAAGDYNNDGFTDLFIAASDGDHRLYKNRGDGSFETDEASDMAFQSAASLSGYSTVFLDFDNDGYLDLLVGGDAGKAGEGGLFLFRNNGKGIFEDYSRMLPPSINGVRAISIADYNEDGDPDIYLGLSNGSMRLLRNDGGNGNRQLKLQLVGLRTGSAKNNHFGIGARVEVRAGEHYQMRMVTEPVIHFGLGQRDKADVVRILWPNGTSQNIFAPGSDQDLVEEQQLKGSCPFLYAWNGKEYAFVKDMMWRSALGMPMGVMGGEQNYAFPEASVEYLKVPGEAIAPKGNKYSLRITAELWETIYFDKVRLIAVDYPDSLDIYLHEGFVNPPFPGFDFRAVGEKIHPSQVWDNTGIDWTHQLAQHDFEYARPFLPGPFQGVVEPHELIFEFEKGVSASNSLFLVLQGWIYPTDASINAAMSQSERWSACPPRLEVRTADGRWQIADENIGFPMGKDKSVIVDLRGRLPLGWTALKIVTNMQIYWDEAFMADSPAGYPFGTYELKAISAELRFRGFSGMYRKNGRHGPHWFDYQNTSTAAPWQDLEGYYTRFGDVLPLLDEADSRYVIMNAGDEIALEFPAKELPPLPPGWKRNFVIYSVGWVKDGDMNTAEGHRVEPLPFHGMSRYPYEPEEAYSGSAEYTNYQQQYNTRRIDARNFRRRLVEDQ